jgi:hypothetical protein
VGRDVLRDRREPFVVNAEGAGFVFLRKSMCRGRSAISSPHRMPVAMAVSTTSRYRPGIAAMSWSYSVGVRVRDLHT